ncbi:hypothetical protein [Lacipirellula sp.]|uniref:hypothetical protein n=1 Tax=Lacipirellula sp. TaxID=2691419 RepID=UPI003D0D601A
MTEVWRTLKPGDRIRLLRVPDSDLRQREQELLTGAEMAGWTADTLERIISLDPVVAIDHVDEYGMPWFEYELVGEDGRVDYHSLGISEDESWERVDP